MFSPKTDEEAPGEVLLRYPLVWSLALLVSALIVVAVFRIYPQWEIAVSDLFFAEKKCAPFIPDEARCGSFALRESWFFSSLRRIAYAIPLVVGALSLGWALWLLFDRQKTTVAELQKPLIGVLSMLIGPLLLINIFMKPFWGRPRPSQTELFGAGGDPYVLPGTISDFCRGNCSFVSGEAGSGFWLMWLVLIVPARFRFSVFWVVLLIASAKSALRVTFGGHFLSDILVGGLVGLFSVTITVWMLQMPKTRRYLHKIIARARRNEDLAQENVTSQ